MLRVALVLALVAVSSSALGQPAGAQAEVLFREGRELMSAGKYPEACAAFEQSQKLEPAISTLLNLAGCREKAGQIATAWGLFLEADRQTRAAKDSATKKLNVVAKDRAQKLEGRVSKLAINVPQASQVDGLEIVRDKERVEAGMWNRALPIDGGTYTISARAPGSSTWTTQVTIGAEHDTKTVEIPDLRNLPRDVAPPKPTAPATTATPVEEESDDEVPQPAQHRSKAVPIAVAVGAAVLVGGAVGFHLWGNATYDDAKAEMTDQARRDSLYDSANQKRYIATGLGAAGIAAAGVSVFLFLRSGSETQTVTARKRQLIISPTGISWMGAF
jgi:hypothetical protein